MLEPVGSEPLFGLMASRDREISKFSSRDAERYPRYGAMLERVSAFVEEYPVLLRHITQYADPPAAAAAAGSSARGHGRS
jgi:hypothetical protein